MFTRPRVYSVIFCLALCCTGFAQAVNAEENPSGPYLGAAVGQFNVKVEDFEGITDELGNLDDGDATAWKVFFGWRFNPYISLEADYIDLGNPSANFEGSGSGGLDDGEYQVDMSGFGLYAKGTLPLGIFELFAKAGYYWHDITIDLNFDNVGANNGNVFESDESGEAWVYGVGGGVTFIDHLNVALEYEMLDVDHLDDPYTLWLNASWRF